MSSEIDISIFICKVNLNIYIEYICTQVNKTAEEGSKDFLIMFIINACLISCVYSKHLKTNVQNKLSSIITKILLLKSHIPNRNQNKTQPLNKDHKKTKVNFQVIEYGRKFWRVNF